jgi:hypothetical protein
MPISNLDEYDKVVNVSWFTPDKDREELTWVFKSITRIPVNMWTGSLVCYHSLRCILYVVSTSETSSINSTSSPTITSNTRM